MSLAHAPNNREKRTLLSGCFPKDGEGDFGSMEFLRSGAATHTLLGRRTAVPQMETHANR
jgi:hypothetical protein